MLKMERSRIKSLILPVVLTAIVFQLCTSNQTDKTKVMYINSFHRGHPSSDDIMDGILENLPADRFVIDTYFMDTKREPSAAHIQRVATQLLDTIMNKNPDILLTSDDNAIKYIVQPHLDELKMPIIFCGVNWTDQEYDLPPDRVTGMLEILPVADMIFTMSRHYPEMDSILFLSENTTTSRKEKNLLDTLFARTGVVASYELVNNFEEWKPVFQDANEMYDLIYLPTNGAIKDWDRAEAIKFITQHIKVPVVTTEDFMMPYCVFGLTKVAKEQGIWVAETAKKLVTGSDISDFPVTQNMQRTHWINETLAKKIGFKADSILQQKSLMAYDQ
jgi:ABC-type uncharacterized transport system substrate-binding protein